MERAVDIFLTLLIDPDGIFGKVRKSLKDLHAVRGVATAELCAGIIRALDGILEDPEYGNVHERREVCIEALACLAEPLWTTAQSPPAAAIRHEVFWLYRVCAYLLVYYSGSREILTGFMDADEPVYPSEERAGGLRFSNIYWQGPRAERQEGKAAARRQRHTDPVLPRLSGMGRQTSQVAAFGTSQLGALQGPGTSKLLRLGYVQERRYDDHHGNHTAGINGLGTVMQIDQTPEEMFRAMEAETIYYEENQARRLMEPKYPRHPAYLGRSRHYAQVLQELGRALEKKKGITEDCQRQLEEWRREKELNGKRVIEAPRPTKAAMTPGYVQERVAYFNMLNEVQRGIENLSVEGREDCPKRHKSKSLSIEPEMAEKQMPADLLATAFPVQMQMMPVLVPSGREIALEEMMAKKNPQRGPSIPYDVHVPTERQMIFSKQHAQRAGGPAIELEIANKAVKKLGKWALEEKIQRNLRAIREAEIQRRKKGVFGKCGHFLKKTAGGVLGVRSWTESKEPIDAFVERHWATVVEKAAGEQVIWGFSEKEVSPHFHKIVDFIVQRAGGCQGIFRRPGSFTDTNIIYNVLFASEGAIDQESIYTDDLIYELANVLKRYVREYNEGIVHAELYEYMCSSIRHGMAVDAAAEIALFALGPLSRGILMRIRGMLKELARHQASTLMTMENLVKLFAPNFFSRQIPATMDMCDVQMVLAEALLKSVEAFNENRYEVVLLD